MFNAVLSWKVVTTKYWRAGEMANKLLASQAWGQISRTQVKSEWHVPTSSEVLGSEDRQTSGSLLATKPSLLGDILGQWETLSQIVKTCWSNKHQRLSSLHPWMYMNSSVLMYIHSPTYHKHRLSPTNDLESIPWAQVCLWNKNLERWSMFSFLINCFQ